ncbi:hypothetical protein [Brachybacterium vulturis]|uniref:hypothetical protein n=1 Tax=Brachybacterium vulturis TaxID=2017484 RepID=UPI00373537C6
MSVLPIGSFFGYVIGGGWGADTPSGETVQTAIIRGADFPSVALQDVSGLPVRFENSAAVEKRALRPGDIVFEISGGTRDRPTGRSVFVSRSMIESSRAPIIPASFCRLVRPDSTIVEPRWLYYRLQAWWNNGGAWGYQNQSTGISNFRFKEFEREYAVSLPTFRAQEGVSEVLAALDDKIAANKRLSAAAFALGGSLVRKNASKTLALVDVADVVMGSSPKGELLNEEGIGMPFYQGVRDFGEVFPGPRVSTESPVRTSPTRSTLFAVRAPVGAVNFAIEEVCIGRGLASISSNERPATLHFCLREFKEIWDEHQGGGTVFASVNGSDVRNARLPIPEDHGGQLESSLAALLDRAVQAEQGTVLLAATRDELLPLLMSGKITVKDAEKTVEGVL